MIIDHISNRKLYEGLGTDIKAALDFFAAVTATEVVDEDIPLAGTRVVIKARALKTKPITEASFEAHKKDIDIHFVISGCEKIGYTHLPNLTEKSYDEENDLAFLDGEGDFVTLRPGYFLIAFPHDGHMPCVAVDKPADIGKMIAKIRV